MLKAQRTHNFNQTGSGSPGSPKTDTRGMYACNNSLPGCCFSLHSSSRTIVCTTWTEPPYITQPSNACPIQVNESKSLWRIVRDAYLHQYQQQGSGCWDRIHCEENLPRLSWSLCIPQQTTANHQQRSAARSQKNIHLSAKMPSLNTRAGHTSGASNTLKMFSDIGINGM